MDKPVCLSDISDLTDKALAHLLRHPTLQPWAKKAAMREATARILERTVARA